MAVNPDGAFSQGDVMRRLANLERQVRQLTSARTLESAFIGEGGLRIKGGRLLAEDSNGAPVFEVTTDPPTIFMRPELIATIAAQVFAERVHADEVNNGESTTSGSFTNLATIGPTVTNVQIEEKAIVFMTAFVTANVIGAGEEVAGGDMSVEVSGPSNVVAGFEALGNSFRFTPGAGDTNPIIAGTQIRATATAVVDNLAPGTYTFQAKYRRALGADAGTTATFSSRNLVVIGL